jgi:hypothetical protein
MKRKILAILIVTITALPSFGQVAKGDVTGLLTGSITGTFGSDFNTTTGLITYRTGGFVTNNLEVGVNFNMTISSFPDFANPGESTVESTLGMGGYATYNILLKNGKTVPYIGTQLYVPDVGGDPIIFTLGINGGVKHFLSELMYLDAGLNVLYNLSDVPGGTVLFQVGFGIIFPKKFEE